MWSTEPKCKKCGNSIHIGERDTHTTCNKCGREYDSIEDELYHATACSGTETYYEINDDGQIKRIHFHNQPLDLLDEAVQNTRLICSSEENPFVLTGIVRKYHDALKKRLQLFLALDGIPKLTNEKKASIVGDEPPQSILNLLDYLVKAFPEHMRRIKRIRSQHEAIIKRMKWVRDKSEHPLLKLWSMPGKIYEDRNEQPNSQNPPKDILDYNFILKSNHVVVNICQLLLDLDPSPRGQEQYKILEDMRIGM